MRIDDGSLRFVVSGVTCNKQEVTREQLTALPATPMHEHLNGGQLDGALRRRGGDMPTAIEGR